MTNTELIKEKIKARKKLVRMAHSWQRKRKSAYSFKHFVLMNWPTVFDRVSKQEFEHLLAYTWDDYNILN